MYRSYALSLVVFIGCIVLLSMSMDIKQVIQTVSPVSNLQS